MEVKKIVEGMTAPQVAQVIDDNFKAQNKILEEDIAKQNSVIGVSEYKDFSEAEAVAVGDVRKYNGYLYECVEATTGAWDESKWKKSSFKAETEKKLSELGSYVENNPEYARVYTDAEGKFLWGIKQDGSVEWAKGVPTPVKEYVESLDLENDEEIERINQLVTGLLADVKVLTDTYHYVSNPEWACAIVDAEERILMGIKADGSYYIPNRDMYHIENNPEYVKVVVDSKGHVLFGIKADGSCYIPKGISEEAKKGLLELTSRIAYFEDIFSSTDNAEWLQVTTDSEGKVLEGIGNDGKKYFPKQEMLEKRNDTEGRSEMTLDEDGKIISYRDSDGTKYEHKLNTENLILGDKATNDIVVALKKIGFSVDNIMDWSNLEFVEIPIPRTCAIVNIGTDKQATAKTDDIETYLEFWDKDGNYFKKPIIINAQGSSSMTYWIKNQGIDFTDNSKIKFGNWVEQDSFHLKKFYIDVFRGQANVGYRITEQVYQSRGFGQVRPYDYLINGATTDNGIGEFKEDFDTGALCHPDGFPILLHFNGKLAGVYAWNLKKHRDNYWMKKSNAKQIILDGEIGSTELFNGNIDWTAFEIRNPKDLIDIDGNEYDGDKPTELSDTDELSAEVKGYIQRISNANAEITANKTKEKFEEYFLVNPFIDYFLISQVLWNQDGFWKNWIWCTWDGQKWTPTSYDMDSIFGMFYQGTYIVPAGEYKQVGEWVQAWTNTNSILGYNHVVKHLYDLYSEDIKERYKELRNIGIFTTGHIVSLLHDWVKSVGYNNLKTDIEECCAYDGIPQTPSYRDGNQEYVKYPNTLGFYNSVNRVKKWLDDHFAYLDSIFEYNV